MMAEAPHGAGFVLVNYKIYKNQRLVGGAGSLQRNRLMLYPTNSEIYRVFIQ